MKAFSKLDKHLSNFPILIVGKLECFETQVQKIITDQSFEVVASLPKNHQDCQYSVIIFSPKNTKQLINLKTNRNFFYLSFCHQVEGDFTIANTFTVKQFESSLKSALTYHFSQISLQSLNKQHQLVTLEREKLSSIGVALSAEKDLNKLLNLVLTEGRSLGQCEGASLYLIEQTKNKKAELVFKLTQNSQIDFSGSFKETRFALTNQSLAGYVALTGEILNIQDVYQLDDSYSFSFDKSFDQKINYRTKELLVLPMKNHKGKVIGVLQFINVTDIPLSSQNIAFSHTKNGFSKGRQSLLESLASQAAVAIDNSYLIENIQNLFEGFVSASVNAIESRDPITSGHSFRVAKLTTGLAEMLNKESSGSYKNCFFNQEQLKEIRYASLLHDFGKVGVKENVLLKANKLHESRYRYLELKIDWQKQLLEKQFYQQLIKEGVNFSADQNSYLKGSAFKALTKELDTLQRYKKLLKKTNQPTVLEQETADELKQMASYSMGQCFSHNDNPIDSEICEKTHHNKRADPKSTKNWTYSEFLLNDSDFLSLSITRGSLTNDERLEIQSHVSHTQKFLDKIPWTDELSAIPQIAGAHHEKLDGTGYPQGLIENKIPLPSKIMAIADIFDALTASDRPYKKALKLDFALNILESEAKKGKIDSEILTTFIQSKIYQVVL